MKELKWISVADKEPDTEVLALGYQDEMLIGYVSQNEDGDWFCESEDSIIEEVTHYILLKDLLKLQR